MSSIENLAKWGLPHMINIQQLQEFEKLASHMNFHAYHRLQVFTSSAIWSYYLIDFILKVCDIHPDSTS